MQDDAEGPDVVGGQRLRVLRVVTFVSGVVWIASHLFYEIKTVNAGDAFNSTDNIITQLRWAQAIDNVAYTVFLFSAVAYVILWLELRDDQRADSV